MCEDEMVDETAETQEQHAYSNRNDARSIKKLLDSLSMVSRADDRSKGAKVGRDPADTGTESPSDTISGQTNHERRDQDRQTNPPSGVTYTDVVSFDDLLDRIGSEEGTQNRSHDSVDIDEENLRGAVRKASNILVLSPLGRGVDGDLCCSLLQSGSPAEQNVILVSLTETTEELINRVYENTLEFPANLSIISGNDSIRSSGDEATETMMHPTSTVSINTIGNPSDLTRLGIILSKLIIDWENDSNRVDICIHSLTSLLQYTDKRRLFRFLHVLQGRLRTVDATTHYHMDSDAHSQKTVATYRPLFDLVINVSADGTITIT